MTATRSCPRVLDMIKNRYCVLFLVGLFLLAAADRALALRYRPKSEETLSHIALIHYGEPRKYIYLVAANGLSDPNRIPRGKVLRVPTVWKYRVKKGDSLASIARRFLKDSERADFLAWLNRIRKPKKLEAGTKLTIPFMLRHRAQQGQTMVDVARRYYFRAKPTSLLRKFNDKRTNALKPGEVVMVPIYDSDAAYDKVKERLKKYREHLAKAAEEARARAKRESSLQSAGDDEETKEEDGQSKDSSAEDAAAEILDPQSSSDEEKVSPEEDSALISEAFEQYRDGEYELAQANLVRVLEKGRLSSADEAEAREILAFCLVAMDRKKDAEHEFVRLLMVAPDRTLDPVTTSPKIMEVFKRAKGAR